MYATMDSESQGLDSNLQAINLEGLWREMKDQIGHVHTCEVTESCIVVLQPYVIV